MRRSGERYIFSELGDTCSLFGGRDTIGKVRDFFSLLGSDLGMDVQLKAPVCPNMNIIHSRNRAFQLRSAGNALKGHIKTGTFRRRGRFSRN